MMGPSQRQLRLLSPQDRIVYKKWLRGGLLFYGSLLALLAFAAYVNTAMTPPSPDMAGDELRTAAISARK